MLKEPETGEVMKSGRTNDLKRRQQEHARDPKYKDLDFDVDARTDDHAEQRGRAQYLNEKYKQSRDKIRDVDPNNLNAPKYKQAGQQVKGKY